MNNEVYHTLQSHDFRLNITYGYEGTLMHHASFMHVLLPTTPTFFEYQDNSTVQCEIMIHVGKKIRKKDFFE